MLGLRPKVLVTLVSVLVLFIGLHIYVHSIHNFLKVNSPLAGSSILVVEGWIPYTCLEKAYTEFEKNDYDLLLTTGTKMDPAFLMSDNSSLVFNLTHKPLMKKGETLLIKAYGSVCNGIYPNMRVKINNELAGTTEVTNKLDTYGVNLNSELEIERVELIFDNDAFNGKEDRNLYIESVELNNELFLSRADNVILDKGYAQIITSHQYFAEQAAYYLERMGADKSKIIALKSEVSSGSRTHGSAVAVKQWFGQMEIYKAKMNLFTMGVHAKRSHSLLEKELGADYKIGVISVDHPGYNPEYWYKSVRGIRTVAKETIGYIYYTLFY